MKKAIQINQTLTFDHEIIVDTDDENILYADAQCARLECDETSSLCDYVSELKRRGVKVLKIIEDGSPENEIEFVDVYTPD